MPHGIILAGGAARRMGGGDKPLRPFGAGVLLDPVVARVAPQVAALALAANGDPARFARWGLPVLADRLPGQGPLAGFLSGLAWARAEGAQSLLVVPGDVPFLPTDLARRLVAPLSHAASAGRDHYAVALVSVALTEDLARFLAEGGRAIHTWLSRHNALRVTWPIQDRDPFTNINTEADLTEMGSGAAGPSGSRAEPRLK